MNTLQYKGYTACVEFDGRDDIFIGRVFGVRDIISFHGESVGELRREFERAVDDFLDDCAEQGIAPEKPMSGKLMLRLPPETHLAASIAAKTAGKSLNQWAAETLESAARF
jgi:predicted HicB family RNase H-like nuclease